MLHFSVATATKEFEMPRKKPVENAGTGSRNRGLMQPGMPEKVANAMFSSVSDPLNHLYGVVVPKRKQAAWKQPPKKQGTKKR